MKSPSSRTDKTASIASTVPGGETGSEGGGRGGGEGSVTRIVTTGRDETDVVETAPVGEGSASGEDGGNTGGCGCDKPSASPGPHAATKRSRIRIDRVAN
eukprot:scaffold14501_cov56-Phaeocystis_antarctica.AAC.3